ncbi:MAG: DNA polymerase III subunit delta [Proteobacteria bacterium]|nr:DNA polymerase III subunit delta [Pseudomonadota bacterium]MBU1716873.1 DNA polymerase III subunit delta [Pseudomonadota bacterium]
MPVYKRSDTLKLFKAIKQGEILPVYLVFGERHLCRQTANELIELLLPEQTQRNNLRVIDGDQEEPRKTLNQLRTYSLFAGRTVIKVNDSKLLYSKVIAKTIWNKAEEAFEAKDLELTGRYLKQLLIMGRLASDEMADLSAAKWKSVFGFAKPQGNLKWVQEITATTDTPNNPPPSEKNEAADLFLSALEEGLPSGNILLLIAEAVDKRKRLYKYISEHGAVVDLTVEAGFSRAADKEQQEVLSEIVQKTLAGFGKKLEPRALPIFLERIGFHPVAAERESEKLALYVGDQNTITIEDLNAIIGRTREEALFELTEALANRNLSETMVIAARLQENGTHPLVIISGVRNHMKKLLIVRSLQDIADPSYVPGLSYGAFQKGYLERLKQQRIEWPSSLPSHPYALFMMFQKAEKFSTTKVRNCFSDILDAEFRLKGSGLPPALILENMFFKILAE